MQITTEFAQATKAIMDVLPMLGETPKRQAQVLSVIASIITDRIAVEDIEAVKDVPEPPPANLPSYPAPADFQEETVIGHIAGAHVIGLAYWNDEDADGIRRYDVRAELAGVDIITDGEHIRVANPEANETGCTDTLSVAYLGRLIELHQAGYLPELLTLARRWCA